MTVTQAYRFALARPRCRSGRSHADAARFAKAGQLIRADRWFPSSKTCSGCGAVKAKLPLHIRVYECDACGLVLDRDVNPAVNLRDLAASGAESNNACGGDVRPGPAGRLPLNQEPGTAPAGRTGTAARQQAAAA